MKLLVSLAPQALWQAKQGQFGLSQLSYAALNAPGKAETAPEKEPAQARLVSDSLNVAQLTALLNQYPDSEFVLAYAAPEQQLGLQLAQGDTPEQAATSWCQQTQALLQLQQQHRKQLKLFNLSFSQDNPVQLPGWLNYSSAAHVANPDDNLYTLLAAQLLRQHSACAALMPRLQASSLPFNEAAGYAFDLSALQQQQQQLVKAEQLRGEITNLNARMQQGEQTVEKTVGQLQKLQHELQRVSSAYDQMQQQHTQATAQLAASNDERDLLLQQLLHVQQEMEKLFQKKQIVKQQYSQLEQDYRTEVASLSEKLQYGEQTVEKTASQLHKLQDELKRITDAHNQNQQQINELTASQRKLQQQLQTKTAQLSASDEERDLLLQQLQHVQEEMEQLFHKEQAVKQQYSQLQEQHRHVSAEHKQSQQQVTQLETKQASLQQQLKQLTEQQQALQPQLSQTKTQLSNANAERDQLLQQLQQVQQELEQYYIKWQQAEQKLNYSDTARDKQQQRELSKLESQLRKSKARAAGAEHQLQLLQQELGAVKSSTLWKTGAPVRALTRLVKKTDPAKQKLQQEAALIITSEYFDIDWYLQRYPDVAEAKINPAEHYLKFGASEGRMPGPLFDGDWYLKRYPDVAQSGINPLLHFIKFGQLEGRSASPKLLADNSTREE